ncbi:hypothetical protein TSMG0111 [Halocynthia phage JM-2012]|uniref:hypothetical protein n=1 Tax=Halocynthia phage JM-2012 TaxID=1173297 RepID=UPI00025C6943|nr:hypothetical protein TSMG0111 [Halocynthia phage JM-2012]AFI55394.1 hypothetical protein TSMG0111 [Halocynthia phage JM-2012]
MSVISIKNNQIEYDSSSMSLIHLGYTSNLRFFKRKLVTPHTVVLANNISLGGIFLDGIISQSSPSKNFLRGFKTVEKILNGLMLSNAAMDSVTMVFVSDEDCMVVHRGLTWFVSSDDLKSGFEFDVSTSDIINTLLNREQQMLRNILKEASSNGICQSNRNSY